MMIYVAKRTFFLLHEFCFSTITYLFISKSIIDRKKILVHGNLMDLKKNVELAQNLQILLEVKELN